MYLQTLFAFCCLVCAALCHNPRVPEAGDHLPSTEAARDNAYRIFNTIHSAMRQWGSSVHHNGLSFFLAEVPQGEIFYFGGPQRTRPEEFNNMNWLAFEPEHSAWFAKSMEGHGPVDSGPPRKELTDRELVTNRFNILRQHQRSHDMPAGLPAEDQSQHTLTSENDTCTRSPCRRGYFHTYRTARPLKLIYIDGQSAAKSSLGTTDSQNHILLVHDDICDNPDRLGGCREMERAFKLCDLAREWGIDGYIRLEAGFEIMYCDMREGGGLDLLSINASPWRRDTYLGDGESENGLFRTEKPQVFEWMRAAAQRYHGLPYGQVIIDWSGMVSAYFVQGMNLSNPDPQRQDLPRVVDAAVEHRRSVKKRLQQLVEQRQGHNTTKYDWQRVTDDIVDQFADRLAWMAQGNLTRDWLYVETRSLIESFIDYSDSSSDALKAAELRCSTRHFAQTPQADAAWTPEDEAIYTALMTVSASICSTLFQVRKLLVGSSKRRSDEVDVAGEVVRIMRQLTDQLQWSKWKECGKCASPSEICFIPMFPLGADEDYWNPRCRGLSIMPETELGYGSYWGTPDW